MYLFHVVDHRSHFQLQIPEGELHLLSLLNLKLLLLFRPPQLISGGVVHHGGVAAIFLLLFQLKSTPSVRQTFQFNKSKYNIRYGAQKYEKRDQERVKEWLQSTLIAGKGFSLEVRDFSLQFQLVALQARLNIFNFLQRALQLRPLHFKLAHLVCQVTMATPCLLNGALIFVENVLQLHHASRVCEIYNMTETVRESHHLMSIC